MSRVAGGVAPDLPGRLRTAQALEEPRLLLGAKNRLCRLVFAEIGDLIAAKADRLRRLAAVVSAPRIHDFHRFFRHEFRKMRARKRLRFRSTGRFLGAIAVLVGDDQVDVAAPAQCAITLEAADGREIVCFLAQAVFVEMRNRRIDHRAADQTVRAMLRWISRFAPAGIRTTPDSRRLFAFAPGALHR